MGPHLLIRADIGPTVGTGHVMRMATLATGWIRMRSPVTMVCTNTIPGILARKLRNQGIELILIDAESLDDDAMQTLRIAEKLKSQWIAIDGYNFDNSYQKQLSSSPAKLMVMDDFGHDNHEHADLIVNQNVYADLTAYNNPAITLCGLDYALLRDEFSEKNLAKRRPAKRVKRILVTFGGADEYNLTADVFQSIAKLADPESLSVDVVIGACNPHYDELKQLTRSLSLNTRLHRNIDRMSTLMQSADLAITAGGSTCYELARCGVPSLIISTADNQRPVAKRLHELSVMNWLGHHDELEIDDISAAISELVSGHAQRKAMIKAGEALVDGKGASRLARRLLAETLKFRAATLGDSKQFLDWRNEEAVRASAFQSEKISAAEHADWYSSALKDRLIDLWVVSSHAGAKIGPVRFQFDSTGSEATISVSVDAEFRGFGWGAAMIEAACQKTFASDDVQQIVALIKPNNASSIKAFENAGFKNADLISIHDQDAHRFVLQAPTNRGTVPLKRSA